MASTITGGIKFFEKSKCLLDDGAAVNVTSGDMVSDFMIDKNVLSAWNSVLSDDTVTEDLIFTFGFEAEIDRIILQDHNFKQYTIKYWNGASYVDFALVYGMSGAVQSAISETVYAADTSYYEFTAVTTQMIKISVLKTQVANDEKYLFQVIATKELGTLQGFPNIKGVKHSRNASAVDMLSGKAKIIKGYETFTCKLQFDNYPASLSDDLDLIFTLFESENPFLVWLCGGRSGSTYFRYQLRGFRLQDIYQMQIKGDLALGYYKNNYSMPIDLDILLEEHV